MVRYSRMTKMHMVSTRMKKSLDLLCIMGLSWMRSFYFCFSVIESYFRACIPLLSCPSNRALTWSKFPHCHQTHSYPFTWFVHWDGARGFDGSVCVRTWLQTPEGQSYSREYARILATSTSDTSSRAHATDAELPDVQYSRRTTPDGGVGGGAGSDCSSGVVDSTSFIPHDAFDAQRFSALDEVFLQHTCQSSLFPCFTHPPFPSLSFPCALSTRPPFSRPAHPPWNPTPSLLLIIPFLSSYFESFANPWLSYTHTHTQIHTHARTRTHTHTLDLSLCLSLCLSLSLSLSLSFSCWHAHSHAHTYTRTNIHKCKHILSHARQSLSLTHTHANAQVAVHTEGVRLIDTPTDDAHLSCRNGPTAYFKTLIPINEIVSYGQEFSGMLGDLGFVSIIIYRCLYTYTWIYIFTYK